MSPPRRREPLEIAPDVRADLERILRDGPAHLARRVRVVLARADGASVTAIASVSGMHRDTVRRSVVRFRDHGLRGLQHGNTGKPKNVIFDAGVRATINLRADTNPTALGEPFPAWSLYKLRDHLIRTQVVRSISVERLRQLLGDLPHVSPHWHGVAPEIPPLSPEIKAQLARIADYSSTDEAQRARALLAVAEGGTISDVATTMQVARGHLRRWIDQFRIAGVVGIASHSDGPRRPDTGSLTTDAIIRLARNSPQAAGEATERWTLEQLYRAVLRLGLAPGLTPDGLRSILSAAAIAL